jgi:hypothetical protein
VALVAEPPPPVAAGPGAPGRRSWRPAAVVGVALAAILLLAVLADGRLLVADPDPSAVTAADVRLARSLFSDVMPPESLADACFADDGSIEPACLEDGVPGGDEVTTDVIPRECRDEDSVAADCIERELGIDVPPECVHDDGDLDVGCLAGRGSLLALTDRCLVDGRLRAECLDGRVYGLPDPGAPEGQDPPSFVPGPGEERADRDLRTGGGDDRSDRDDEEADEDDDAGGSRLGRLVSGLFEGVALLLLVGLVVALLVALVVAARRRGRRTAAVEPDADDEAHDRAVMAASLDASAHQLDLSGDPRRAIIAAYAMLLEGLAACAQPRHPAETPLEHLERVLAALDVRPEPLRDLTTLFG